MGKVFNDLTYGNFVPTYAGLPIEAAENLANTLDTRYRENTAAQDQLEVMIDNLDVRDVNRPHVQQALDNAKNKLQKYSEDGDWENAGFAVKSAAKQFSTDKYVRGALQDKQSYDSYMANLNERLQSGEIDAGRYNKAMALASRDNTSQVEYDEVKGEYKNIFSAYSPQNYQDVQKAVFDMGEKWKSSEHPRILKYKDKNGNAIESTVRYDPKLKGYIVVGTQELLTEAELQSGLKEAVMANPKYKAYIEEGIMLDKRLKLGSGANKRPMEITDVFGDDGVLNLDKKEAETLLASLGYDYNLISKDELLLESLYDQLSINKKVDGYVNPAASAYSYENIKEKYLTDNVMLQAMEDRAAMARTKYKARSRAKLQRDAQSFKLKQDAPIITYNQGAISQGDKFDSKVYKKSIIQTKGQLAEIERKLKANKNNNTGSYNILLKQQKDLKFRLKTQENNYNGYRKAYLQSPEGKAKISNSYRDFIKKFPSGTAEYMTKQEFKERLKKPYSYEETNMREGITSNYSSGRLTNEARRNSYINSIGKKFTADLDNYVKSAEPESFSGNVLQSSNTKSYVNKMNKTITDFVNGNRTNFTTAGGIQLDQFIEQYKSKGGVTIKVAMTDGDKNGEFPHYLTIVDKKTGKTLAQENIFSKTGNITERYNTGVSLMNEHPNDSETYKIGNYMAASASFPAWKNDDLEGQLRTVTEYDDATVEPVTTEIFQAGTSPANGQPMYFKIKKSREQFANDDGTVGGINTVLRLVQVSKDGSNIEGYLPNPAYGSKSIKDKNGASITKYNSNVFHSMDDMKVALFNLQKPNPDINKNTVTGYSQSSTKSSRRTY